MKDKQKKEVEVKSIKYIDADMDVKSVRADVRRVDLNGKQKEEIQIQISPERIKQLEK
ncbi:MAG: hypothetical protein IJX42_06780 [Oscillospiraceae bacterium]|nr:hypothetical protein [Oscillospiraceae bacterium]